MKLIEKLSDKYYQDRPQGFGDPRADYEAGFRKAREMITDALPPTGVIGANEAFFGTKDFLDALKRFGEKEVDE